MPAVTIDLQKSDDMRDVVHRAVEALSAGKILALPTETVYELAVSALNPGAVERLSAFKNRSPDQPFSVSVRGYEDSLDYIPDMSKLARRFAQRCWPGPVTLVLDGSHRDSVLNRLSPDVRRVVMLDGTVGLRVPAHELTLQILRLCAGPVIVTSANEAGKPPATDGDSIADDLGNGVDIVLNDGPTHFAAPSSVVKVTDDNFQILQEGVVNEAAMQRVSGFCALVVCTGNTCRSPMAEGILRQLLSERLNCAADEIEQRGATVMSAGISAGPGGAAASQAIEVMSESGIDLRTHSSQAVTPQIINFSDVILTMTNGHRAAIVNRWPHLEKKTFTVRRDNGDISDPIGGPVEVYRQCAEQIRENLVQWVETFDNQLPNRTS
jgi:protein-tyrosine phosphatase